MIDEIKNSLDEEKDQLDWSALKNCVAQQNWSPKRYWIIHLDHKTICEQVSLMIWFDIFEEWIKEGVLASLERNLAQYHLSCSASNIGDETRKGIELTIVPGENTPKDFNLELIVESLDLLWVSIKSNLSSQPVKLINYSQKFLDCYWLEKKISFNIEKEGTQSETNECANSIQNQGKFKL
jgi:hypothetical protein